MATRCARQSVAMGRQDRSHVNDEASGDVGQSSRQSVIGGGIDRRGALVQLIRVVVPPEVAQLPFPMNCIPLHSQEGLELLESSIGSFEKLFSWFETQGPLQCGVTSLAIALNVCREPGTPRFTTAQLQEELRAELKPKHRFFSTSLDEIGRLAQRYSCAQTFFASDVDCNFFRTLAVETLEVGGSVIVNFKRSALGYNSNFAGHCSPLAAYNSGTDEFLVMDVAQKSFQPVWIPAKLIFDGMNTIEKPRDDTIVAQKTRGFLIIEPPRPPRVSDTRTKPTTSRYSYVTSL